MTETLGEIGDIIAECVAAKLVVPYNLRDWFAGMALQGMLANREYNSRNLVSNHPAGLAETAFAYADAMIAERMKK